MEWNMHEFGEGRQLKWAMRARMHAFLAAAATPERGLARTQPSRSDLVSVGVSWGVVAKMAPHEGSSKNKEKGRAALLPADGCSLSVAARFSNRRRL